MILKRISLICFVFIASVVGCVSTSPVVRPYRKDSDQEALIAIMKENPGYLIGPEWGNTEEEQLTMAKKYLEAKNYHTLVLEVDAVPVGFVNYHVYSVPLYGWLFGQKAALLHLLGVSQKHKRKGYGLLLSTKAIEAITQENVSYVVLAVKDDNKSAVALYEKLGFYNSQGYLHTLFNRIFDLPIMYRLDL